MDQGASGPYQSIKDGSSRFFRLILSGLFGSCYERPAGGYSYGKGNSYGHPDPGVVKRMEHLRIKVLTTGGKGSIRIWVP